MKNFKYLFTLIFLLQINLFAQTKKDDNSNSENEIELLKTISNINLSGFDNINRGWSANSMKEYLIKLIKHSLNRDPKEKRELAFNFFSKIEENEEKIKKINIEDTQIWTDLNLYKGQKDKNSYIANALDRTNTEIGRISFYKLLALPINDIQILQNRQKIIKTLVDNKNLFKKIDQIFYNIQKPENILLGLFDEDHFLYSVERFALFNLPVLNKLNKSENCLLLKDIFMHVEDTNRTYTTILSSVALIYYALYVLTGKTLIPEGIKSFFKMGKEEEYWSATGPILRWICKVDKWWIHSIILIMGGIYCGLKIQESARGFIDSFLFEKTIYIFTSHLAQFINKCQQIYEIIKTDETLKNFDEFKNFVNFFETELVDDHELQEFFKLNNSQTFKNGFEYLFSHKGKIIKAYSFIHKVKRKLEKMIEGFANIDAYLSIAKLYNEFEDKKLNFCFAEYATDEKPYINIENFWHPLIEEKNVITNSLILGDDQNRQNIILTGPNAGGKSICLKAITLSLLLAQTIGISPAEKITFTPFTTISTYLNITDDVGAGQSLFKSEVLRCQELINKIEKSKETEFHFQVFDEIFNGTTPEEGMAAAYGVAKHLSNFNNNICLLATHFKELTNLEIKTSSFENYKVSVDYLDNGKLSYPYKLEKGKSVQHVAFDILQNQGFSGSIIDDAKEVLKSA